MGGLRTVEADPSYEKGVERVVSLLSSKWAIRILCSVKHSPVRLSELMRSNPSASKKALTASLRSLESAGIILRRDLSTSVLHVEYELEQTMRDPVIALLDRLARWEQIS